MFFAFAYNALGVPVAAGILYPFTGLLLSPMIAAAAMSLSSVSVIVNALRLSTDAALDHWQSHASALRRNRCIPASGAAKSGVLRWNQDVFRARVSS